MIDHASSVHDTLRGEDETHDEVEAVVDDISAENLSETSDLLVGLAQLTAENDFVLVGHLCCDCKICKRLVGRELRLNLDLGGSLAQWQLDMVLLVPHVGLDLAGLLIVDVELQLSDSSLDRLDQGNVRNCSYADPGNPKVS
jgi:hypothetical protein